MERDASHTGEAEKQSHDEFFYSPGDGSSYFTFDQLCDVLQGWHSGMDEAAVKDRLKVAGWRRRHFTASSIYATCIEDILPVDDPLRFDSSLLLTLGAPGFLPKLTMDDSHSGMDEAAVKDRLKVAGWRRRHFTASSIYATCIEDILSV